MANQLILHRGAREVTRTALDAVPIPDPTATWFPVAHGEYLSTVHHLIAAAGLRVARERYALADGRLSPSKVKRAGTDGASLPVPGARFFGILDLDTSLSDGAALAIGLRNSHDQSFSMSFVAGSRVFVCDNLAFSGELLVSRLHTANGLTRLREAVSGAVGRLESFRIAESEAIRRMQATQLGDEAASHLILSAYRRGIVGPRVLPSVLRHWEDPGVGARLIGAGDGTLAPDPGHAAGLRESFGPRNAWSLYNAHTSALGAVAASQPHKHADATMRLRALFSEVIGDIPLVTTAPVPTVIDVEAEFID